MSIKKAIAAGHICLDITPAFKSKEEKNIKDLFRPGQLIAMDAAKVSLGGSVSNTGVGHETSWRRCRTNGNGRR